MSYQQRPPPPNDLSPPWIAEFDPNYGQYYYVNTQSGERTWQHPISPSNYGPPSGPPPGAPPMAYAAQQTTYNSDGSVIQQRVAGTTQSGGGIEGFLHNHHKLAGLGAGILAFEGAEKYQEAEGERPHRFEDAMLGLAAGVGTNAAINHYTGGQGQQQQGGYPQQQQGYYQGGPLPQQQQQQQGGGLMSNFMHSGVGMTAMGGAAAFGGYELYEHEKHKHEREREQEFLAGERFEEQQQQQEYGREEHHKHHHHREEY